MCIYYCLGGDIIGHELIIIVPRPLRPLWRHLLR
jgi:hypothetical protein